MSFFKRRGERQTLKNNFASLANHNKFDDIVKGIYDYNEANLLAKSSGAEFRFLCQKSFNFFLSQVEEALIHENKR